jgi:hypothetical protein
MPFEVDGLLGEAERDILRVLTLRVRVLTLPQISRTWSAFDQVRRVKRLEAKSLIARFTAVAHPELPLSRPVLDWTPGASLPEFSKASHTLRSRWNRGAVPTPCVIASVTAGRMFGGHGGRFPRESEETHDIHLAAVYLKLRKAEPELAASWMHEEEIKAGRSSRKEKLPDAILRKSGKVVEFGGAYRKAKLVAFHEYCAAKGLAYEVW